MNLPDAIKYNAFQTEILHGRGENDRRSMYGAQRGSEIVDYRERGLRVSRIIVR